MRLHCKKKISKTQNKKTKKLLKFGKTVANKGVCMNIERVDG